MKKNLLILSLLIVSFTCYSQQTFEKGYFIDNSGQKIKCQIKIKKWRDTPVEFEYRFSENDKFQKATIDSVKEFGIDNSSKYIRRTVYIDRYREDLYNLSNTRAPEFEEEQLFLQVLVEGKASLYLYSEGNTRIFFFNKETPKIDQLVFKTFITPDGNTLQNNEFRKQLGNNLKCSTIKMNRIQNLEYKKPSMVNLFIDYNNCISSDFVRYEEKKKSDLFHIAVRPRTNYSSLSIEHTRVDSRSTDFGNNIGFGIGVEVESTLPFNSRKWALFIEPTFQYFESEKSSETNTVYGGIQVVKINYKSIELPVGLKHYFFFKQNSKLFLNAAFVFDYSFNSSIDYARSDSYVYNSLEMKLAFNPSLGIGYQYGNYSLAVSYQSGRDVLTKYSSYDSDYYTTSIILGYSLF